MDSSVTRRGKPCWYRVPGVGNTAINDSFILESQIYRIVKHYFKDQHPAIYAGVLELMHETTMQTEVGQLDLTTQPIEGPVNLDLFTLKGTSPWPSIRRRSTRSTCQWRRSGPPRRGRPGDARRHARDLPSDGRVLSDPG